MRAASASIRDMASSRAGPVVDGADPVQLGEAAHGGQRGSQLVPGVGHELAHPCLRGLGLPG